MVKCYACEIGLPVMYGLCRHCWDQQKAPIETPEETQKELDSILARLKEKFPDMGFFVYDATDGTFR